MLTTWHGIRTHAAMSISYFFKNYATSAILYVIRHFQVDWFTQVYDALQITEISKLSI